MKKRKRIFCFRNTNQKYRSERKQCCGIKQKDWRDKNQEKLLNRKKQCYEDNRGKICNQKKYYDENRYKIITNQIKKEKIEKKQMSNFD